jgi:hypothetical protein
MSHTTMDKDNSRIKASFQLFDRLNCCSATLKLDFNDIEAALALIDEDKMRCLIISCLTALHLVQIQKREEAKDLDDENYELVKSKVFNTAISMITGDGFDRDEAVIDTILSCFTDERKMSDERSWQPVHFAIALRVRNKISDNDIRIMLSKDPLGVHRCHQVEAEEEEEEEEKSKDFEARGALTGCTPNTSSDKYSRVRDPKAPVLRDQSGRCALHLVAQFSESLELLKDILRIDHR